MHREPKSSPSCSKGRPDHQSLNELIYLHVLRKFKLGQRHIQECERRYIGLGLLMISKVKTKLLQVFMWAFPTLCSEFLAHSFGFPSTVLPANGYRHDHALPAHTGFENNELCAVYYSLIINIPFETVHEPMKIE